jgi:hypothetical protein
MDPDDKVYLQFTDKDGDPIYILNDITAIYTSTERTTVASMHEPVLRTARQQPETRAIVSASSGGWHVRETYEEILNKIKVATECA